MNDSMGECRTSSSPRSEVVAVSALDPRDRDDMFALLDSHFEGVTAEQFTRDLREKESVLLLRDCGGRIRGFSTIMRLGATVDDEPIAAFFSGDTVVAGDRRADAELPRLWGRHIFRLRAQMAERRVFWFLIASGYKTYRFLPVFFREFYPTWRAPTPGFAQRALHALGFAKFGDGYDPAASIVRLRAPTPLRRGVADLSVERLRNPDVAFFARANPGHLRGDELACLCEIAQENLTAAGRRMVGA
jgi:hypothetical protein